MDLFDAVEDAGNDVMPAGRLPSRKNHSHIQRLADSLTGSGLKGDQRHSVSVRKEHFNLFLVIDRRGILTFTQNHFSLQGSW